MERRTEWVVAGPVLILGLALRLVEAARTYLNADEIHYFFLSIPVSFKQIALKVGIETDHPPLLYFLLHPIAEATSSEVALRLIPVLAGAIFPCVVYRWLARVASPVAGLAALVILTLSPNLVFLSAQIRGYTVALLFAALALLFLETALDNGSVRAMLLFTVSLDLAILTEYSAAYFAAAVGVFFLLQAADRKVAPRLWVVWAAGQLSALGIYAVLYRISIRPRMATKHVYIDGFLRGSFPAPHENLLVFGALGTLKQFAYAFSSIFLGIGAAILFGIALVLLWSDRSAARRRSRIFTTLLVAPFLFACTGALLMLHPYARSRHTVILSLFVAAGVGIGFERIFRSRPWAAGICVLTLGIVWMVAAVPDQQNIERSRDRRTSMLAAMDYLRSAVPHGALVLADRETDRALRFYMPDQREIRLQRDFDTQEKSSIGPLNVIWRRWDFGEVDDFRADLAAVRKELELSPDAPIWVVDGGFDTGLDARLRKRYPGISLPAYRDFDGAVTVFQVPAGI